MKPMLAQLYAPSRLTFPAFCQPKLNGIRALYQDGRFYSRDEIQWHSSILAHLGNPLSKLINPNYHPLDGELYIHGWSLQKINSAVAINQTSPGPRTHLVEYHVFDVVNFNKPFWDRYSEIYSLLQNVATTLQVRHVPTRLISTISEGNTYYENDIRNGYEGQMYRLGDGGYTKPNLDSTKDNRTYKLLKRKDFHDDEFLIIDVVEGRDTDKGGQFVGSLGALLCQLSNGLTFRVGSGFTNAQRKLYWLEPPIGKKAQVKYLMLSDDGIPLNPTFLTLRENV